MFYESFQVITGQTHKGFFMTRGKFLVIYHYEYRALQSARTFSLVFHGQFLSFQATTNHCITELMRNIRSTTHPHTTTTCSDCDSGIRHSGFPEFPGCCYFRNSAIPEILENVNAINSMTSIKNGGLQLLQLSRNIVSGHLVS